MKQDNIKKFLEVIKFYRNKGVGNMTHQDFYDAFQASLEIVDELYQQQHILKVIKSSVDLIAD